MIYRFSVMCFYIWLTVLHRLKIFREARYPLRGAFICAANHVSLGDPTVIGATSFIRHLHFMAKEELFQNKRWGWWFRSCECIPLSRNKKDHRATKTALNMLKKGKAIGIFPEGGRSETGELGKPEVGVGFLADKANVPVIPIYVKGTKGALPKGGKYKIGSPIEVYIGKPVDFSGAQKITDRRERYTYKSNEIMQAIAHLKKKSMETKG